MTERARPTGRSAKGARRRTAGLSSAGLRGLAYAVLLVWLALTPGRRAAAGDEDAAGDAKTKAATGAVATWRVGVKQGLQVQGLSNLRIHPKKASRIWAFAHGLGPARSEDGGRTWRPMLTGIVEKYRPKLRSQVRISFDPRAPDVIYVVIDGQIYRSKDGGDRWENKTSGALASLSWSKLESTHLSWEVRIDRKKSGRLLIGTRNDGDHNGGLFESSNAGKSWKEIAGTALPDSHLGHDTYFVRMDPKTDKIVNVAGEHGVFYSDDRGRSFKRNDPGGEDIHDLRWLSDIVGKDLYLADARGIWRSKNGGKSWDRKSLRQGDALRVFIDPSNRRRLWTIWADKGIEFSQDAAHAKWAPYGGAFGATKEKPGDPAAGYRTAEIRQVLVHPRDKKTIYLASPVTGLHVSKDGGRTFAHVDAPEDHDDSGALKRLPAITASMALVAIDPSPGGMHLAVSDEGVVYGSADRCETWSRVGRLGQAPGVLVTDGPGADGAPSHAWLAGGRRLLRSADGGATWQALFPPADGTLQVNPESHIVAVHRGPAHDGQPGVLRVLLDRSGVIMTSADDGKTWVETRAPQAIASSSDTWAADMAVDPGNEDHIVLAARTTAETWNSKDTNGGVFETWDGGAAWTDLTGLLRPGKRPKTNELRAKAYWNRADFVGIDAAAGLLIYGADRRGIFVRPFIDPKAGKKLATPPVWVDVTPKEPKRPEIMAHAQGLTADGRQTRLVVQLVGVQDQSALYEATGAALKARYARVTAPAKKADPKKDGKKDAAPVPTWTTMPSPGAGVHLTSLVSDGQLPGRLVGTESDLGHGILIYEVPGSKPETVKKSAGKKDGAKKDGAEEGAAAPALVPPEGMRAFTAGQDKTVRIWAVDTGAAAGQLTGHANGVFCVALSPDESYILSGSEDRTLRVWNASHGKPLATVPLESAARDLAIDDDSQFVYVAMGETKNVAQIEIAPAKPTERKITNFVGHKGAVLCVATSEDVQRVYSGGEDNVIIVWDSEKGTEANSMVVGAPVVALAVSRDGAHVYAAGRDGSLAAFDAAGKPAGRLEKLPAPVTRLALAPDGATLYAATTDGILVIATDGMKAGITLAAPGAGALTCVTLSADGLWIFAGDAAGGLWMWARGQTAAWRPRAQAHEGAVHAICVTPDETELAEDPGDIAGNTAPKKEAPKKEAPKKSDAAPKPDAPAKDAPKKPDAAPKPDAPSK